MSKDIDPLEHRDPSAPVDDLFVRRWSPRALRPEALSEEQMRSLFEAARWAPSSYNGQPWRFLYARRGSEHWQRLFDLLVEFNQKWADDAGALIVVLSQTKTDSGKSRRTHSFDAGSAWQNLALQATSMGLAAHAMEGFDYDRAREELGVPDDLAVEAMIAVGYPGDRDSLPEDLREREEPSGRKPLSEIAWEGAWDDQP